MTKLQLWKMQSLENPRNTKTNFLQTTNSEDAQKQQTREIATSECKCCRKPEDCENENLETESTTTSGYYEM